MIVMPQDSNMLAFWIMITYLKMDCHTIPNVINKLSQLTLNTELEDEFVFENSKLSLTTPLSFFLHFFHFILKFLLSIHMLYN